MPRRIIQEYIPPSPNQASVFQIPNQAIAVQYNEKLYIDYILDNQIEPPDNAYYIGEQLLDGSVNDIVGTAADFPHVFVGWDRPVPEVQDMMNAAITPRQARLALLEVGLLETVQAMVAQQDANVRIQWEYANDIKRNDPLVCGLLAALGKTPKQIDELFILASFK